MSVADILAAARGQKGGAAPPAEAAEAEEAASEPAPDEPPAAKASASAAAKPAPADKGSLPKDVDGIIAYCRRVDAKG
jgi:hypothetical protein